MDGRSAHSDVLLRTVERWRGHRVVVVGDVMLDEWRFTEPAGLCREAPVPVVTLQALQDAAGGAGNTAVNLAALGARPVLVAPVGDDGAGDRVRACLMDAGVAGWWPTARSCSVRRTGAIPGRCPRTPSTG
jgi:D-beta-D-heptose 7-phosphate kinase/D-beta-D-heptose 1-phosphate adenosyltransferase